MAKSNLTITFKAIGADGEALACQLDEEKHLEEYGETRSEFYYGESAWIKVYPEPADLILNALYNAGSVTEAGSGNDDVTDRLTFDSSTESTLSKLPVDSDNISFSWFGTNPGTPNIIGKSVKFQEEKVAIGDASYTTPFKRFKLSGINETDDEFPVIIVIKGEMPSEDE